MTGGGASATYQYDPFGHMVSQTENGTTQDFVYDGQNLILVLNSTGGVIERELNGAAVDQVLASENASNNVVSWYLTDNQGTVRDVAQYNGTTSVIDHLIFDSFRQLSGQVSGGSYYARPTTLPTTPRFGYAGMRLDSVSGLYYDNARWYDPANGVFVSQDPLGFGGGPANTEEYVGNSPTNGTDPSGMASTLLSRSDAIRWAQKWSRLSQFNPDGSVNQHFAYAVATALDPSGGGIVVDKDLSDAIAQFEPADEATTNPKRPTGCGWLQDYCNWFESSENRRNYTAAAGTGVYITKSLAGTSNDEIAHQSDGAIAKGAIVTSSVAVLGPIAFEELVVADMCAPESFMGEVDGGAVLGDFEDGAAVEETTEEAPAAPSAVAPTTAAAEGTAALTAEQVAFWQEQAATAAAVFERAELQLEMELIDGTAMGQTWWFMVMDTGRFWLSVARDVLGRW